MEAFEAYLRLMVAHPELFRNSDEDGSIRIITDPERIRVEQDRIRGELRAAGKPEHWIDIGVLSEDEWCWTVRDLVEFPGGKVGGYIRSINRKSQEGGFNVVLMCMSGDCVLLIRKFRHDERDWGWEFPRGFGEAGLSAEENARKELEEEIGVQPVRLIKLTEVREGKGGTCVFCAQIAADAVIKVETGEGIGAYRWLPFTELDELVRQGKMNDWFSLWAYVLAKNSRNM